MFIISALPPQPWATRLLPALSCLRLHSPRSRPSTTKGQEAPTCWPAMKEPPTTLLGWTASTATSAATNLQRRQRARNLQRVDVRIGYCTFYELFFVSMFRHGSILSIRLVVKTKLFQTDIVSTKALYSSLPYSVHSSWILGLEGN